MPNTLAHAMLLLQVHKSANQDTRPGERVKRMVVHVDNGLVKRRGFVETLSTELEQIEVTYLLESSGVPNSLTWHRNIVNRTVNDDAMVSDVLLFTTVNRTHP